MSYIDKALSFLAEGISELKVGQRIEYEKNKGEIIAAEKNGKIMIRWDDGQKESIPVDLIRARAKKLNEDTSKKVTIEKSSDGEYRVPAEDGFEDGAYYTDAREDAIDTCKSIYGKDVEIKFKTVGEFVGGKYEKYKPGSKLAKQNKKR